MRPLDRTRALVWGTVALGGAALVAAAAGSRDAPLAALALLAAAVVLTELLQVQSDGESLDPLDGHPFSFSTGVHLAAGEIPRPGGGGLGAPLRGFPRGGLRGGG